MISSLVGSPSGFSTTTSQCSKSQPSSKIVSLGGRFDQLGFGSLSDEEVARVAKPRSAEEAGGIRRRATPAAARGRRRERVEREEAAVAKVAVVVVVVVVERERERKDRVLGRERERIAMVEDTRETVSGGKREMSKPYVGVCGLGLGLGLGLRYFSSLDQPNLAAHDITSLNRFNPIHVLFKVKTYQVFFFL